MLANSLGTQRAVHIGMRTADEINAIAEQIIGAAIDVHRRVGPGCLESVYAACLAVELTKRRLDFRREVALQLRYDDLVIPRAFVADYKIEDCIIAELKAKEMLTALDKRQMLTYLELDGAPLGLLINFGGQRLIDGIARVVNNFPAGSAGIK